MARVPPGAGLCHADRMTVQVASGGRRVGAPGLVVRLLGRPGIERHGDEPYRLRSRKSWALLTYLLLTERPTSRARLAELLFAEADDPLRALRWSLAEIRRALADEGTIEGDPVVLTLADDVLVDVVSLSRGSWVEAVEVAGTGGELLEGPVVRGAPAFESWLLSERRRLASATESVLHEAALGLLARGELDRARGFAVRAAAMSPLDENHQALVIRLYRLSGDDAAAERQYRAFAALLDDELGVAPGTAVEAARHERPRAAVEVTTDRAVEAVIEAGAAAIAAGATDPGITSLRSAVPLADAAGVTHLRVESRLALAEALIHSVRGQDEEGQAHLHEADRLALADGDLATVAQARAELGYVDFLRARYDRAEVWLTDAVDLAQGSAQVLAKATTYLGTVHSDRGSYPQAVALLDEAARLARRADDPRREAYALAMRGRVDLLRGHSTTRPPGSPSRWRWPSAGTGCRSSPGRRRCRARCSSPATSRTSPRRHWNGPSPGPATSATRAGRASRPAGSPSWPRPPVAPARPSTRCSTHAPAAPASRTPTSGCDVLHPRCPVHAGAHPRAPGDSALGRHHARAGLAHRYARAHRARPAALRRPGGCR